MTLGVTNFPKTTSESTYKAFDKHHFPERAENKAFGILNLACSPETYKSMYDKNFNIQDTPKLVPKKRFSVMNPLEKLPS